MIASAPLTAEASPVSGYKKLLAHVRYDGK
nr:MAG TPA: hypothetical protein [Caudoviricetes sp.]